jgi:hypothetical protein
VGARHLINKSATFEPTVPPKVFNRKRTGGSVTNAEKSLVAQFVADQPSEITTRQVNALGRLMRRTPDAIRKLIEEARENFQSNADFYVKAHKQAVETALDATDRFGNPDPKALDAAIRGSQWALENVSAEGVRVVDKAKTEGPTGPRILVGINVGGLNTSQSTNDTTSTSASTVVTEIEGEGENPSKSESL